MFYCTVYLVKLAIEQLGYELSDNYGKASLKMFFVKLKDLYWLGA